MAGGGTGSERSPNCKKGYSSRTPSFGGYYKVKYLSRVEYCGTEKAKEYETRDHPSFDKSLLGPPERNAPGEYQDTFAPVLDIPLKTSANVAQGAGASLTRHED